jgi:hypothetical protein
VKRGSRGIGQARLDHPIGQKFFEVLSRWGLQACGYFFRKKFNEKIRHY